jgi:SHS2 domain-containing protein
MYEFFDHTADVGLSVVAPDLDSLFAEAARGFSSLIVDDLSTVRPAQEVSIAVAGADRDYLLFDWLNELLRRFEQDRLVFSEFDVHMTADGLTARARGEPLNPERHRLGNEVKAVTYHQLDVRPTADGWSGRVIFDI